jgi:hypothetical protein
VLLRDLAHARSGDKGGTSDITVVAFDAAAYDALRRELSPDRIRTHFADLPISAVDRYELPQLYALKFVLHGALDGGVTQTLNLDPHGKCLASCLLALSIQTEHESPHD